MLTQNRGEGISRIMKINMKNNWVKYWLLNKIKNKNNLKLKTVKNEKANLTIIFRSLNFLNIAAGAG